MTVHAVILFCALFTIEVSLVYSAVPHLHTSSRAEGEWAACTDGSKKGMCINTLTQSCTTSTVSGLCPGPSEVRCCLYPAGATSSGCTGAGVGVCTLQSVCPTTAKSGLCPGPSQVMCCPKQTTTSSCTLGTAPGCATSVAAGLTRQLIAELNAMGYSFTTFAGNSKVYCSGSCQPSLQSSAWTALSAAASASSSSITLNSAYRSSAQQFLLYYWRTARTSCGYRVVATPGTSNHEGGLAIDTSSYSSWRSSLESRGWRWYGSGDPVHFDYVGSGGRGGVPRESLRAFQRLWNRNNPADRITEDGLYGSNTAARLMKAPCNGW